MKKLLLTTAVILLLTSAGVGYVIHANPETTSVSENSTVTNHQKVQIGAEDIDGLVEYENQARRIYNGLRGFCDEVYLVRLIG